MKKLLLLVGLALAVPVVNTSCTTPANQRVVAVQSLTAVGESAEATVALSAHLYQNKQLTADQAKTINSFYDGKFQPAFRLAVATAKGDLSSPASPDVQALALQLAALLAAYTHAP